MMMVEMPRALRIAPVFPAIRIEQSGDAALHGMRRFCQRRFGDVQATPDEAERQEKANGEAHCGVGIIRSEQLQKGAGKPTPLLFDYATSLARDAFFRSCGSR